MKIRMILWIGILICAGLTFSSCGDEAGKAKGTVKLKVKKVG